MSARGTFSFSLLLLAVSLPAVAADHIWTGVERIVAVGDVHGDYDQFAAVLRSAGVIDENDDWIGGARRIWSRPATCPTAAPIPAGSWTYSRSSKSRPRKPKEWCTR